MRIVVDIGADVSAMSQEFVRKNASAITQDDFYLRSALTGVSITKFGIVAIILELGKKTIAVQMQVCPLDSMGYEVLLGLEYMNKLRIQLVRIPVILPGQVSEPTMCGEHREVKQLVEDPEEVP